MRVSGFLKRAYFLRSVLVTAALGANSFAVGPECVHLLTEENSKTVHAALKAVFSLPSNERLQSSRVLADRLQEVGNPLGEFIELAIVVRSHLRITEESRLQDIRHHSQKQFEARQRLSEILGSGLKGWFEPDLQAILKMPSGNFFDYHYRNANYDSDFWMSDGPFRMAEDGAIRGLRVKFASENALRRFREKKTGTYLLDLGVREFEWELPYGEVSYTGTQWALPTRYGLHLEAAAPSDLPRIRSIGRALKKTEVPNQKWAFSQVPNLESIDPDLAMSLVLQPEGRLELGLVPAPHALRSLAVDSRRFSEVKHLSMRAGSLSILRVLAPVASTLESLDFGLNWNFSNSRSAARLVGLREALAPFTALKHFAFRTHGAFPWTGGNLAFLAKRMPLETLQITAFGSGAAGRAQRDTKLRVLQALGHFSELKELRLGLIDYAEQDLDDLALAMRDMKNLQSLRLEIDVSSPSLRQSSSWLAAALRKLAKKFPLVRIELRTRQGLNHL